MVQSYQIHRRVPGSQPESRLIPLLRLVQLPLSQEDIGPGHLRIDLCFRLLIQDRQGFVQLPLHHV